MAANRMFRLIGTERPSSFLLISGAHPDVLWRGTSNALPAIGFIVLLSIARLNEFAEQEQSQIRSFVLVQNVIKLKCYFCTFC